MNELLEWVLNTESDKEEKIAKLISAFSEFIYATDKDYLYNKTYLKVHAKKFIQCQKILKWKYEFLRKIVSILLVRDIEKGVKISIDNIFVFEQNKLDIQDTFSFLDASTQKIKYDFEYFGKHSFAVANEILLKMPEEKYKEWESYDLNKNDEIQTFLSMEDQGRLITDLKYFITQIEEESQNE